MINRIIEISEGGYFLRVEDRQLVLEKKGETAKRIPLSDIAVLVLGTTWATYSHSVLSGLAEEGAVVVVADGRGMPASLLLPMYNRSLQAQRLAQQIAATEPTRKRLWQRIVGLKIENQGRLLRKLHGDDFGLLAKAKLVKSGDKENLEGQAARIYWARLYGDPSFRRTPGEGERPNHFLDYGYAVLRGMVARAICATGLHPTLGLHHHHRDNSFCLADDLMEPFRPIVDHAVCHLIREGKGKAELDRDTKSVLVSPLLGKLVWEGNNLTLFDGVSILTASLARILEGEEVELNLPAPLSFD